MLFPVGPLPGSPVEAATRFHIQVLPRLLDQIAQGDVILVFDPADHTHRAWRTALVQGLARENAPRRVNAVATADGRALEAATAYLSRAPGVTGQYFVLDGEGAGNPLGN